MNLCSNGHVISNGRETCDRDNLPPSVDEHGNSLTNSTDTIMDHEEVTPEEAEATDPKAGEDSSVDSSETSEASAEEAQAEAPAEAEAEVAPEAEVEAPAEEAAPVEEADASEVAA